jgi:signal transduction histidine kinase
MARKEKNEVQIRISDNGTGISKKERRFIFKPFFRSIRHSSIQGHGLGLQSVQLIIKALNGKVTLDSILGKGSTFSIHIPDK